MSFDIRVTMNQGQVAFNEIGPKRSDYNAAVITLTGAKTNEAALIALDWLSYAGLGKKITFHKDFVEESKKNEPLSDISDLEELSQYVRGLVDIENQKPGSNVMTPETIYAQCPIAPAFTEKSEEYRMEHRKRKGAIPKKLGS